MATNAACCPKCGANLDVVGMAHRCVPIDDWPSLKPVKRSKFAGMTDEQLRLIYNEKMKRYMREWRKRTKKER